MYVRPTGAKVVASDLLPKYKLKKPAIFVSNTEENNKSGAHWIVIGKPTDDQLLYFDSLCVPPLVEHFYKFLQRNAAGTKLIMNKYPLQSETSAHCGRFCVLLIWNLHMGGSLDSFCAQFGAGVAENDIKLERMWKKFTRHFDKL